MPLEFSLTNYPYVVSNDGVTWHCQIPGCCWTAPKAKKSLIVYHKNTHFPKYICQTCNEAFPQKSRLDTHVRTKHTGEKPYPCPHCDKCFVQMSNMNDHVRKHHTKPAALSCESISDPVNLSPCVSECHTVN